MRITDLCYELMREHDLAFCHKILTAVRMDNPSIKTRTASFNAYPLDRLIQLETHGKYFRRTLELASTRKQLHGRVLRRDRQPRPARRARRASGPITSAGSPW